VELSTYIRPCPNDENRRNREAQIDEISFRVGDEIPVEPGKG